MNTKDLTLILLLFFLLLPMKFSTPAIADVEPLDAEGFVAVIANSIKFDQESSLPTKSCECNGTKRIRSGDGILQMACPCGANCTCKKVDTGSLPPTQSQMQEAYTVFFTAKWCGNCVTFKSRDVPKLVASGWNCTNKYAQGTNLLMVDIDENPTLFSKYSNAKKKTFLPFYVVVRGEKVLGQHEGYLSWKEFAKFHNDTIAKDKNDKID